MLTGRNGVMNCGWPGSDQMPKRQGLSGRNHLIVARREQVNRCLHRRQVDASAQCGEVPAGKLVLEVKSFDDFEIIAAGPSELRLPPEKITTELYAAGYSLIETYTFLPRQNFLVFQRKHS
jgi:hypothetical protein